VGAVPAGSDKSEKIAMTAPVGATPSDNAWKITFMMPSKYTQETLPDPIDSRVKIEEVPGQCAAVIRFNGFTTQNLMDKKTRELRAWMNKRNWIENGTPVVARFNDPFTLPWRRRNEIQIPVAPATCTDDLAG
jgi:hypothetical protein